MVPASQTQARQNDPLILANQDLRAPGYAERVIRILEAAGFEAWIVGGWVRDALRGMPGHDVDVTTDAPWRQGAAALREAGLAVHETGVAHGTITVICEGEPVEVTTYRTEGVYTDHRHPDEVRFVRDVREDLARRDLTFNAMAWHPERGLMDPFGGREDLARGLVRTVGSPDDRFGEDALRVLRTVRFAARMGFDVEPLTQEALRAHARDLSLVASERIGKELDAIVGSGLMGRVMTDQPEVLCAAIPELSESLGFDQRSVYHVYDVYEHTAHVCRACEAFTAGLASNALRWAALLHDVAKPMTYSQDVAGHGHFFDHTRQGAIVAGRIMRRMAMPSEVVNATCALIRHHDERLHATERAIRKLLARLAKEYPGREVPLAFELIDLMRADAVSKRPSSAHRASDLDRHTEILRAEVARGPVFSVRQLAVGGADVIDACGIAPGPAVGMQLDMLLQAVMAGEVTNDREELVRWLKGGAHDGGC